MKYKAIIFDLYGTLVDNFSFKEHNYMLKRMSIILELDTTKFTSEWLDSFKLRILGKLKGPKENIIYICKKLKKEIDIEKIDKAASIRFDFERKALKPRKDYIKTLKYIKTLGYKLGLISDCSYETSSIWENSEFYGIINNPVFSSVVGIKKPDKNIYLLACRKLGVKPSECIYIGDGGSNELTGAAEVGMKPIRLQVSYEKGEDTYRIDEDMNDFETIENIHNLLNTNILNS